MEELTLTEAPGNGFTILIASGTVDSNTYLQIQNRLHLLLRRSDVAADMSGVIFMSSSGLGALIAAIEAGDEFGSRFWVLRPSAIVRLAIESSGFSTIFNIIDAPTDAV